MKTLSLVAMLVLLGGAALAQEARSPDADAAQSPLAARNRTTDAKARETKTRKPVKPPSRTVKSRADTNTANLEVHLG